MVLYHQVHVNHASIHIINRILRNRKKMNQEQLSEYYKNGRIARCECEVSDKKSI